MCSYLSRLRGLLVLDNCEHVVDDAASLVVAVFARCPDVRVLTTSREPLRTPGEQVVHLDGLDEHDAIELFGAAPAARSVSTARPGHGREDRGKVDGLPLALELAAARTASLSLDQLEAGLEHPLDVLGGERVASTPDTAPCEGHRLEPRPARRAGPGRAGGPVRLRWGVRS